MGSIALTPRRWLIQCSSTYMAAITGAGIIMPGMGRAGIGVVIPGTTASAGAAASVGTGGMAVAPSMVAVVMVVGMSAVTVVAGMAPAVVPSMVGVAMAAGTAEVMAVAMAGIIELASSGKNWGTFFKPAHVGVANSRKIQILKSEKWRFAGSLQFGG
jgi:hypothetical protein